MARNCFGREELQNLTEVVEGQDMWRWGRSNFVPRFEAAFGEHLGRKYVHAVNSGTNANESAYAALGLEPGDEIICPAIAPVFVSFPIVAIGCVPVFVDVDPRTQIIDPDALDRCITPRAKAVVVVHLYGQPARMDDIMAVARKHNLRVIEDCAQAYDSFHKGRKVGTIGDISCFSMQQSKHITAGEGGMIATDDVELYKRATEYSNCGMPWYMYDIERPKAEPVEGLRTRGHFSFGHDFRMSELQGAVALAQLGKIGQFNAMRRELVDIIEAEFAAESRVELAYRYPDTQPNYWVYPLRVPEQLGNTGEINYVEVAYQQMQAARRTSVGVPLPDYIQYRPGICPRAEASTRGLLTLFVHHSVEAADMRQTVADLKAKIEATRTAGGSG